MLGKIKDFGAYTAESSDYPDFAHPMASAVENGEFDFGISLCGTGNGINMTVTNTKEFALRFAGCPKLHRWHADTTTPMCFRCRQDSSTKISQTNCGRVL
jgi:hypothetical protein